MKNLTLYLKESEEDGKNGHYEDFVDEETGEVVSLWVADIDPEEEARRLEQQMQIAKQKYEQFEKIRKQEEELYKLINPIEDQIWGWQAELKDLNHEYRELQMDQEEEVGSLYVAGKEAEAEKLAQEYGLKFNQLEKKQQVLVNKIKKLKPKLNKLNKKLFKLWDD